MKIAVDAMGGDFAPAAIVDGALQAVRENPAIERLFLVGDQAQIEAEVAKHGGLPDRVEIRHASEVIEMGDSPAAAVRRKRDSSINRAVDLVKTGEASAVFAAGSTGAAVAASTLKMRMLEGIRRPGIAIVLPTPKKPLVLLDAGATPDCSPENLVQFAIMGSVYSKLLIGVENPSVALMSVGSEEAKGNSLSKETFSLLETAPINFVGNAEGNNLFEGELDVVVCDGFTGNVILKTSEGVAHAVQTWLKASIYGHPIRMFGAALMVGAFRGLKKKTSKKTYGGAPLLGVNGICIIGHGSSDALAAKNGILQAARAVKAQINEKILEGIRAIPAETTAQASAMAAASAAQDAAKAAAEAVAAAQAIMAASAASHAVHAAQEAAAKEQAG